MARKITINVSIEPEQKAELERLSKLTNRPQNALVRDGLELVFQQYGDQGVTALGGRNRESDTHEGRNPD